MESLQITREIPIWQEADVCVVGGGPAGIATAICAARHGAKTILCDNNGYLGGMATAGQVGPFMTCYDPAMRYQVIRGFFDEFVRRMEEKGGAIHPSQVEPGTSYSAWRIRGHAHVTPFSSEVLKRTAEEMCLEAGVKIFYHCVFQDVVMDGEHINAALFATKAGLKLIRAEIFVDTSGDADLACRAGAPYEIGPNNNGKPMPSSMFFIIDGVDKAILEEYRRQHDDISAMWFMDLVKRARANGEFPIPREKVALYESVDGTYRVNMSRLNGYDSTDPEKLTEALIEGRRQAEIIFRFLKKYVPGCSNIRMIGTAPALGVRESRRILGKYFLTAAEMMDSVRHEDDIFLSGNRFDMHVGSSVVYETTKTDRPYGIPYRILLPNRVNNLLVAGRAVSGDQKCMSAIRVMPPCFAMGHAAGIAAAMAVKEKCSPANIDVQKLRDILRQEDCLLDEPEN